MNQTQRKAVVSQSLLALLTVTPSSRRGDTTADWMAVVRSGGSPEKCLGRDMVEYTPGRAVGGHRESGTRKRPGRTQSSATGYQGHKVAAAARKGFGRTRCKQ